MPLRPIKSPLYVRPAIFVLPILLLALATRAYAADEPKKANLIFSNAPLSLVITSLENQTGDAVVIKGKIVSEKVTTMIKEKTTKEILDTLANQYGWVWWNNPDSGQYELMDLDMYQKTVLPLQAIRKVFRPIHRSADEIRSALEGILTPNLGSIGTDPTTNKVIVTDLPDRIAVMQRIVDEMDVPVYTRIFTIHHAELEDIESLINPLMSEIGEVHAYEPLHKIIVRDLFENIKRMEMIIREMDRQTEMRVYNVNSVTEDSFEALIDAISDVVTDESAITFNYEQGRFFVEDIPEVHDKIERLLKVLDQPVRQILLQAEIVEIALSRTFEFGVDQWDISRDMERKYNEGSSTVPLLTNAQKAGFSFKNLKGSLPLIDITAGQLNIVNVTDYFAFSMHTILNDSDTKVLLKPRIIVKNQEQASIRLITNEPVFQTYNSGYNYNNNNDNDYRGNTSSQTTIATGLTLEFTPSISNNGLVELEISLENSEPIRRQIQISGQGDSANFREGLGSSEQSAETVMIIPSGQTRVLGGFIRQSTVESKSGVPGLRDIPILGALFGSYREEKQDRTLLFFLTPTIIEEKPQYEILAKSEAAYADLFPPRNGTPETLSPFNAGSFETIEPLDFESLKLPEMTFGAETGAMDALPPLPFAGIRGMDETGPFAGPGAQRPPVEGGRAANALEMAYPDVMLTDAPPPELLPGDSIDRAFGDRKIVVPETNYKSGTAGPSGKIKSTAGAIVQAGSKKTGPSPGPAPQPAPVATKKISKPKPPPTPTPTPRPTPPPRSGSGSPKDSDYGRSSKPRSPR